MTGGDSTWTESFCYNLWADDIIIFPQVTDIYRKKFFPVMFTCILDETSRKSLFLYTRTEVKQTCHLSCDKNKGGSFFRLNYVRELVLLTWEFIIIITIVQKFEFRHKLQHVRPDPHVWSSSILKSFYNEYRTNS